MPFTIDGTACIDSAEAARRLGLTTNALRQRRHRQGADHLAHTRVGTLVYYPEHVIDAAVVAGYGEDR